MLELYEHQRIAVEKLRNGSILWGEEEWVDIDGFPNHMISNFGHVCNWKSGIVLKSRPSGWGYQQVMLYKEGKAYTKSIHLMVANAFVPGWDNRLEPNHKDGDKSNNHEENLEWVTKRENNQHAIDMGLRRPRGTVIAIVQTGEIFKSVKECAEYLNTWSTTISAVLHGRQKDYKGLTFCYAD